MQHCNISYIKIWSWSLLACSSRGIRDRVSYEITHINSYYLFVCMKNCTSVQLCVCVCARALVYIHAYIHTCVCVYIYLALVSEDRQEIGKGTQQRAAGRPRAGRHVVACLPAELNRCPSLIIFYTRPEL